MDKGDEIMAFLEEDCPVFEEELVDGVMRILEQDIMGEDSGVISESTCSSLGVCGQTDLQSDSAHSVTSSSAVVSDPDDLSAIGWQCAFDELGYLMEASDEELGLSPQPASRASSTEFEVGEVDLGMEISNWLEGCGLPAMDCFFNEMVDFESLNMDDGLLGMQGMQVDWVPYL